MNILEFSVQLRQLSNAYSEQKIIRDEYRSKRKQLLDMIDQTYHNQDHAKTPQYVEKHREEIHSAITLVPKRDHTSLDSNR